ncbi:MAG: hypothetical protein DWQ02_12220, partial [Bacteroidetes bacterium]
MEPMPDARAQSTSCTLDGLIYIIGGIDHPASEASTEINVYDPATNIWLENLPDLPVTLCGAASFGYEGKIYVFGGHSYYDPFV